MPSVTLVCQHCSYSARRQLANVTACRGVHETPSEPAYCPKGHGLMIRKDGFAWEGSSNPVPDKQHNWRRQIVPIEKSVGCYAITTYTKCTKCGQSKNILPRRKRNAKEPTEHWWTFHWDREQATNCSIPYDNVVRWRRWIVTLYKFDSADETDWRLYLPGNVWLGVTIDKE